jgi:two-component system sensor histidine kinase VicK
MVESPNPISALRGSIRLKIFLAVALTTLVVVGLTDLLIYRRLGRDMAKRAAAAVQTHLAAVAGQVLVDGLWLDRVNLERVVAFHTRQVEEIEAVRIFDYEGKVLLAIPGNGPELESPALPYPDRSVLKSLGPGQLWSISLPVVHGREVRGAVAGLIRLTQLNRQLRALEGYVWLMGLLTWLALVVVLYWSLDRLVSRPVRRLSQAAGGLARGRLEVRSPVRGEDEIGTLSQRFNEMADSMTRAITGLDREKSLLSTVVDALDDYLYTEDRAGRLTMINKPLAAVLGRPLDLALDRPSQEVIRLSGFPVESESWPKATQAGEEGRLELSSGDSIPVRRQVRELGTGSGEMSGRVVILRDVTQERELARLRAEWDSFFRHEIKAPLTPILGLSRILAEEGQTLVPETREAYLNTIRDSAASLARVLDMTQEARAYEAGRIDLELRLFDLAQTVKAGADQALREVEPDSPGPGSRIRMEVQSGLDTMVEHDPGRMRRVFKNLVKNGLEHDPGPVQINICSPPEEPGFLTVSIANQGEPIPSDRLAVIFEKFNTTKKNRGGTGLGTTIARLFTRAHGGRIGASSSAEEGTVFTVSLPRKQNIED